MNQKPNEPTTAPIVPAQYAGQWIAWDSTSTRIIGSGKTLEEAAQAAQLAGEEHPVFAKVPKADVRFVGARN